jgi:ribosomal-protein-alanine N-acetyltransferase
MHPEPHFTEGPFVLRRARTSDVAELCAFHERNQEHFRSTGPRMPADASKDGFWALRVAQADHDFENDRRAALHLFHDQRIVGQVNLMNFVRGALQGCDLGYGIDVEYQGQGRMFWAVTKAIEYAFTALRLHRIQANHLPDNERSARLLARTGFKREGYAERFLLLDGAWRDHVLNALYNDAWQPAPGSEFLLDPGARSPV